MICLYCNKKFTPTSRNQKLCSDECKLARNRQMQKEWRDKRGIKPRIGKSSTICWRSASCVYGETLGTGTMCDYIGKTGMMRGGYPDECTHYKKRKKSLSKGAE